MKPIKKEIVIEIREALEQLGWDEKKCKTVRIDSIDENRYVVYVNGEYFGIWDSLRKTFVD